MRCEVFGYILDFLFGCGVFDVKDLVGITPFFNAFLIHFGQVFNV